MYCPTCNVNLCVFCYRLFHFGFDIVNMEESTSTIFKGLKVRKLPNCVLLCGIKFYVTNTQLFWSLWGVYSHKLFLTLNKELNLMLINREFISNIIVTE